MKLLMENWRQFIAESTDLRPYQDIMQEFLNSLEPEIAKNQHLGNLWPRFSGCCRNH